MTFIDTKSFGIKFPYYIFRYRPYATYPDNLKKYLHRVFEEGQSWHEHIFPNRNRISQLQIPKGEFIDITHAISLCANHSMELYNDNERHTKVQKYLMDNDSYTIACEVPIFDKKLCGHIDIIRYTDKIEIWDYKWALNKNVDSQLYWYATLIKNILHIDYEDMRVGYFTNDYAKLLDINSMYNFLDGVDML